MHCLRRIRDFAQIKGDGMSLNLLQNLALNALNVDESGLDEMDNRILSTIIEKFKGGPTGHQHDSHRRGKKWVPLKKYTNHSSSWKVIYNGHQEVEKPLQKLINM